MGNMLTPNLIKTQNTITKKQKNKKSAQEKYSQGAKIHECGVVLAKNGYINKYKL